VRYAGIEGVRGCTVRSVARRGKYLLLALGPIELVIHLGMSGRLFATTKRSRVPHCRVILHFSGRLDLVLVDRRRFGIMRVVPSGQYGGIRALQLMGPEPLSADFEVNQFVQATSRSRTAIKPLLLRQRLVAGLGNIYVDEALYRARIHPATRGLERRQATRLHGAIRQVLREAIARRGTTFSLYRDGLLREGDYYKALRVFDREGQLCRTCGTCIVKMVLAGRGTHFCPGCQAVRRRR
jgi:formamidopyrimidine-DNA glycosylase